MKVSLTAMAVLLTAASILSGCSSPTSNSSTNSTTTSNTVTIPTPAVSATPTTNALMTNWNVGPMDSSYAFKQYAIPASSLVKDQWNHVVINCDTATNNYTPSSFDVTKVTKFRIMGYAAGSTTSVNTQFYIANLKVTQGTTTLRTSDKAQPTTGLYVAQGTATPSYTNSNYLGENVATLAGGSSDIPGTGNGFEFQYNFDTSASALTSTAGLTFDFYLYIPTQY
jgi:hypothetical protein